MSKLILNMKTVVVFLILVLLLWT